MLVKKVLVAVDDSENLLETLDFGLDLAEKYNACMLCFYA
jgi:nucleotide-binding universal stress UspA family protein